MQRIEKKQLFEKGFLVADGASDPDNQFEVLFSLAALFNIRITSGEKMVQQKMLKFVSEQLGTNVPAPFYQGFPKSVRELSANKLAFDQFLHYTQTYGMGWFDQAGHSVFEQLLTKTAFKEITKIKDFAVLSEEEAKVKIEEMAENYLDSSRPLNDDQYALVLHYVKQGGHTITHCASKNTLIRLLSDSRNLQLISFLSMSDVIKLVDEINYRKYQNRNIKKLNLKNQDRKFITAVMNQLFAAGRCDLKTCFEKKAVWNGLLHHIHYQPKCEEAEHFVACMRGKENQSVYSAYEKALTRQDIQTALTILHDEKSPVTVLRNLNYLISRCSDQSDIDFILNNIKSDNTIVLIQLLLWYSYDVSQHSKRSFVFTKYNQMIVHTETDAEFKKRKSFISEENAKVICAHIKNNIRENLKNRLGKVYIDPDMVNIALPIQENTSQSGYGVLAKGSRLPIENGKKIRAFTYWEKVKDIDLSVVGIDSDGKQIEFSWRTMANKQSTAITYSGDETSGYNGGSEYFDINIEEFRRLYPNIQYLVFCDNVYSGIPFCGCFCKAGYMLRDTKDSGEIFEPKTVQSSFVVDCNSTFAYLFSIDLENREFIWLNAARQGRTIVAGATSMNFLTRYFSYTSVMNMYMFFEMMASELVNDPADADVIVSDKTLEYSADTDVIHSWDFDKVLAYMNSK